MKKTIVSAALGALALGVVFSAPAQAADVSACLITKTESNPFFVKMKEGATAKAQELGVTLKAYAGKAEGDNESQVAAIETCIADGAKGILLVATDTKAIVPTVKKARDAGLVVIALDTQLDPPESADATFATDNFLAGTLIGKWAAGTLGDKAKDAKIGLLDINASQPSVDVQRDQGFLTGFGIDVKDVKKNGDEDDPRIVGNEYSNASEEGARTAVENLLQKDSDLNVVYTINEPAAAGAYEALKAVGKEKDVLIVSVDGGCPGVKNVAEGVIGATSQQYPLMMAALGVEAIKKFADTGELPKPTEGKNFFDTGVSLVTDKPVAGVESIDTKTGTDKCWG
ncbi:fructose transport system substrate-binding protein [Pararhizobium capsulatum DSM 1112]|uniref:Fructose transport system substrate-binding protein n=1 Tax=Pararhizobium capsulatum DSM 1112 TaxID=1121113 RepID=A0ABU0BKN0_9HYPH|nr:sugar ABC transporter substrate-binding protein [Pararhizobium capsulatum]MDQ0318806.1 fructose transport system substrate-binding protein [Pararhizobium capsulatum DSM 1112]